MGLTPSSSQTECKISCRLELLPGKSVVEQIDNAQKYGFDAISLPGRYLSNFRDELLDSLTQVSLPLIAMSLGFEGSLVSPDKQTRKQCRESLVRLFDLCQKLNVKSVNMPPALILDNPIRHQDEKLQDELLESQLDDICEAGKQRDVTLLLEPVNQYETDYMTTVSHAAKICAKVNHEYLGLTPDFFHMQIEELSIPDSLASASKWIKHVHVAENTRVEPGPGSLDFSPGFSSLKGIGYDRYIEIECRKLSGDPDEVLPRSVDYLRDVWKSA